MKIHSSPTWLRKLPIEEQNKKKEGKKDCRSNKPCICRTLLYPCTILYLYNLYLSTRIPRIKAKRKQKKRSYPYTLAQSRSVPAQSNSTTAPLARIPYLLFIFVLSFNLLIPSPLLLLLGTFYTEDKVFIATSSSRSSRRNYCQDITPPKLLFFCFFFKRKTRGRGRYCLFFFYATPLSPRHRTLIDVRGICRIRTDLRERAVYMYTCAQVFTMFGYFSFHSSHTAPPPPLSLSQKIRSPSFKKKECRYSGSTCVQTIDMRKWKQTQKLGRYSVYNGSSHQHASVRKQSLCKSATAIHVHSKCTCGKCTSGPDSKVTKACANKLNRDAMRYDITI